MVQEMFVRKINLEGCACPVVDQADPPISAIDHTRELVIAMDGEERWQIDEPALLRSLGA
jgi:hypothetical protein